MITWNDNNTISIDPPAKGYKKISGTRFAAVLGLNDWTTAFEAWCAITRTYEKPFEDNIYTSAGKTIEPKQAEFMKGKYFWRNLLTPADKYGEDYFNKTRRDFFPDNPIFGGMWDYLFVDKDGKPETVLEMKTTKRSEDWLDDIPEYYAMQAALYAYLLGVDDVIMVCTILEEKDYQNPEGFVVNSQNTFERPFKVSERYPNMDKIIATVEKWWKKFVEGGVSPKYDEKKDAEILKELRSNNLNPETDLTELLEEAETLQKKIDGIKATYKDDEKRLDKVKDLIKQSMTKEFKEGINKVVVSNKYQWTLAKTVSYKVDEDAMEKDGILDKYKTKESVVYRLTNKEIK